MHLGDFCAPALAVKAPAVVGALKGAISLDAPLTQRRKPAASAMHAAQLVLPARLQVRALLVGSVQGQLCQASTGACRYLSCP